MRFAPLTQAENPNQLGFLKPHLMKSIIRLLFVARNQSANSWFAHNSPRWQRALYKWAYRITYYWNEPAGAVSIHSAG